MTLASPGDEVAFGIAARGEGEGIAVGYRQPSPAAGETAAAAWLRRAGSWSAAGGDWQPTDSPALAGVGYLERRGVTPSQPASSLSATTARTPPPGATATAPGARSARSALSVGDVVELDLRAVARFEDGLVAVADVRRERGDRDGATTTLRSGRQ